MCAPTLNLKDMPDSNIFVTAVSWEAVLSPQHQVRDQRPRRSCSAICRTKADILQFPRIGEYRFAPKADIQKSVFGSRGSTS
jgi:hypothetical protein